MRMRSPPVLLLEAFKLLILVVNLTSCYPGSELDRPSRIVGGEPIEPGEVTWQVSFQKIVSHGEKIHFCGGALIAEEWIATAAHCTLIMDEFEVIAVVGAWNLKAQNSEYRIVEIFRNKYDNKTNENDIAVVKIDRKHPYQETTSPRADEPKEISLERTIDVSGRECLISGWGRLSFEGDLPNILHAATVSLLEDEECEKVIQNSTSKKVFDSNVCAGGGDQDACQGDSGGPLVCCEHAPFKKCSLTGITSWGIGCATPGIPGIYTEVAYYKEWIEKIIKTESD